MIKIGDKVIVGGIEATVEAIYAAGAHRNFKLSDSREVLDLTDAALVKPKVSAPTPASKTIRKWDWLPKDGQHDIEE